MTTQRLLNTLESGEVLRYHAAPGVTKQTDAHHAWGVAVLAMHICPELSVSLLKEAILHDSGELVTGDMPYTAKMVDSEYKRMSHDYENAARVDHMIPGPTLTERELAILKVCDTLEGLVWCNKEESHSTENGLHRGQVWIRWMGAYERARQKFNVFLTPTEWTRADEVFTKSGGSFADGFLAGLAAEVHSHE